jgi:hypothetical protein
MICGSSRVSVRLDGPGEGDLVGVGRGGSPRPTSTLISRSTSSSSMIITGSLGVALGGGGTGEGCFWGSRRQIQYRFHLVREPASDGNARSLTPAIGDRYSSHPERSKVCERDRGGEVSRALPLPFREDNPEKSSVRSMISSVGVAAAGDVDLEDPTLGLVRGTFSSSSEEMTCVVGDRVLR